MRKDGERMFAPARSETSCMHGNSVRENREGLRPSSGDGTGERTGKDKIHKPVMNGRRQSDSPILPTKPPNNASKVNETAEVVEGRGLTKRKAVRQNTSRTQSRIQDALNELDRIRQAANRNKEEQFTALLHHITVERLYTAFLRIKKNAVAGVDGVTWKRYEKNSESNLRDLHARIQRGAYRVKPSRRAYIPKPDGRLR